MICNLFPFPTHIIPGNHEIGNKYSTNSESSINPVYLDQYESVYGDSEWSFTFRNIRFSGMNSFLLGSGLQRETKLRAWLQEQTTLPRARRHFWIMHPALFIDHVEEPNFDQKDDRNAWYFGHDRQERSYLLDIFQRTGTTDVISGHIHCRREIHVDGITYHFAPATAFPQWGDRWPDGDDSVGFLRFVVQQDKVQKEFVPLAEISSMTGYGPGGNPDLAGRDYTVAWEQPPFKPVL